MKASKLFGAVALATTVSMTAWAGAARADTAADLQIMIANAPDAVEALQSGLQDALTILTDTHSLVQTSHQVGSAWVAAGSALVAGTTQFGALGLGLTLLSGSINGVLDPYLGAIDDPSTAAALLNPDDISTLLGTNLAVAIDALLHGDAATSDFFDPNGLTCAAAELLRGNLIAGPGFGAIGTPAVLGCAVIGLFDTVYTLTQNTNYAPLSGPVLVGALVLPIAAADYIVQLEDALADLFAALAPVTEPLAVTIGAL